MFLNGKLFCTMGNYMLDKYMAGKRTTKHTKRVNYMNSAQNAHRQQHT